MRIKNKIIKVTFAYETEGNNLVPLVASPNMSRKAIINFAKDMLDYAKINVKTK